MTAESNVQLILPNVHHVPNQPTGQHAVQTLNNLTLRTQTQTRQQQMKRWNVKQILEMVSDSKKKKKDLTLNTTDEVKKSCARGCSRISFISAMKKKRKNVQFLIFAKPKLLTEILMISEKHFCY